MSGQIPRGLPRLNELLNLTQDTSRLAASSNSLYFNRLHDIVAQMLHYIPDDSLDIQWALVVADEEVLKVL